MSNALVIAAVTAVLKDILENGLTNDAIVTSVGDTLVTAIPPDRISVGSDERPQLNLFLYQVSQNRNADWIVRDRPDQRVSSSQQPPLALDLHYLLTAYGAKDFQAELLLGYALQLLHDIPVIDQERCTSALQRAASASSFGVLSQALSTVSVADVVAGIGSIKLNAEFFSMEETSKLWSSLQTHYRPSAAYRASMVVIESRQPNQVKATTNGVPLPTIDTVEPIAEQPITTGSTLILKGNHLQGDITQVRVQGRSQLLKPTNASSQQVQITLPSDLRAGMHGVQVVHHTMSQPLVSARCLESNLASFVLQPLISVSIQHIQRDQGDRYSAELTIKVTPRISKTQRVVLIMSHTTQPTDIYPFPVEPLSADAELLHIPVTGLPAGTYWVQLQVDGAQSCLHRSATGESIPLQVELA